MQDSQRVESLRTVGDDATDMVGRRHIICNGDAQNLQRRDSDYSRQWWKGCNLTLSFRVDEDDFLRFRFVERQVFGPCQRLDVVKLCGPRVSVDGRDNEIMRYVSSANLYSFLPAVLASRSPALITYDASLMPGPRMMLAVMDFIIDI